MVDDDVGIMTLEQRVQRHVSDRTFWLNLHKAQLINNWQHKVGCKNNPSHSILKAKITCS